MSSLVISTCLRRICFFAFGFLVTTSAVAEDYFAMLDVRYESGLKKTFLGGPYKDKQFCEKNNQIVWDNVRPVCGGCQREIQLCGSWSQLNDPLRKVMHGEMTMLVYVSATPKNKIIFSGASRKVVEEECELSAKTFRENGYSAARCIR